MSYIPVTQNEKTTYNIFFSEANFVYRYKIVSEFTLPFCSRDRYPLTDIKKHNGASIFGSER